MLMIFSHENHDDHLPSSDWSAFCSRSPQWRKLWQHRSLGRRGDGDDHDDACDGDYDGDYDDYDDYDDDYNDDYDDDYDNDYDNDYDVVADDDDDMIEADS